MRNSFSVDHDLINKVQYQSLTLLLFFDPAEDQDDFPTEGKVSDFTIIFKCILTFVLHYDQVRNGGGSISNLRNPSQSLR